MIGTLRIMRVSLAVCCCDDIGILKKVYNIFNGRTFDIDTRRFIFEISSSLQAI